ncbi:MULTISPECIES: VC0807 family protein [unclassified Arthrobacter]|uniref:VC0807 family protein n=1 Tax=unclassified Arthrobacter TaxID=235627 RepID=UPI000CE3F450|nr:MULTISPECIES: VC0807 family protein [unclassified Arthrobacter]
MKRPAVQHGSTLKRLMRGLRLAADLLLPLALFYGLRAMGVSAYLALLAGTAVSLAGTAVDVVRRRTLGPVTAFVITLMVFSTGVSLIAGDVRFLLARGAWATGLAGAWFLASAFTRRPLVYLFSRPLLEGRFGWPGDWDAVWERVPRFRRVWRVTSVAWGLALIIDCVLRIFMAYTLPVDSVPSLSAALSALTTVVLITFANVYYQVTGTARKWSLFYDVPETPAQ